MTSIPCALIYIGVSGVGALRTCHKNKKIQSGMSIKNFENRSVDDVKSSIKLSAYETKTRYDWIYWYHFSYHRSVGYRVLWPTENARQTINKRPRIHLSPVPDPAPRGCLGGQCGRFLAHTAKYLCSTGPSSAGYPL